MQYILLLLCVGGAHLVPIDDYLKNFYSETCGYESCTQASPGMLNVHIVPHTHDDVGWLKTVDQYYYGSRNNIQKAGVQYILDSVVKELWESPKRRFIYVETAFFWKWWVRQPASIQQKVQVLVRQGRLQMVGGAWSMNDEAASHYQSTIDQFTWGLRKFNDTFGQCGWPHVGWQIDPFGHSREFASLLAMMGYDGLFLGRIDYQDKRARLLGKNMEMVWRGDDVLGKSSDIFTGVLYNTYSPPPGFCFDVLCSDEPIIDDPNSPLYNVETKIPVFLDYVKNQARYYKTNNVIVTMGGDFTYQDAAMWYINLDKLIKYSNLKAAKDGMNISVFYSTPNCYLKAVKEANPTLPTKQDDFFPYASDPTAYWTGYFTSRPTTKYFEREGNNYLQTVKQLQVLADLDKHNAFVLNELKSAMGVMQHHDAITGTEKQHVTHDYERLLNQAIDDAFIIAKQAFNKMTGKDSERKPMFDFQRCHLNESRCDVSENSDNFVVTIYNPLGWSVNEPIRIPVTDGAFEVFGPSGTQIKTQIVPISPTIIDIPTRSSKATQEIVFLAELKPLSYKTFYVKKENRSKRSLKPEFDFYNNINNNIWPSDRENGRRNPDYEKYLTTETVPSEPAKNIKDKTDFDKDIPTEQSSDKPEDIIHKIYKENGDYEKYMTTKSQTDNIYKNINVDRPIVYQNIKVTDVKKDISDKLIDGQSHINHDIYKNIKVDEREVSTEQIPDAPVYMADISNIYDKDINFDVLKGGPQEQELKVLDLERILVESDEKKQGDSRQKEGKSYNYPMFNTDEMRMLSDDPQATTNDDEVILENQHFKLTIDKASGSIKHITFPDNSKLNFTINMYYYIGICGDNHDSDHRASGAYIFRPSSNIPIRLESNNVKIINGDITKQLRVYLSPAGYIDVKLYDNQRYIEIEWLVGPIPVVDEVGKEYVIKYESELVNEGIFYTDSNGRQMLKRQKDYRPQWNVTLLEPVPGNYYPVTNEIYIRNENDFRMSVLTDRSEGGSSLTDGDIELMLHRRLLCDDAFGVGEALNETANEKGLVARGKHRLYIGEKLGNLRNQVLEMHQPPVLLFSDAANIKFNDWSSMRNEFSWLDKDLPKGLHLLTLEPWDAKLLIRFENYFEDENAIEVNLQNLFKNIKILAVQEMMLAAHRPVEGFKQWTWNTEGGNEKVDPVKSEKSNNLTVKVKGKEIKTFLADYEVKETTQVKSSSPGYTGRYEVTTVV